MEAIQPLSIHFPGKLVFGKGSLENLAGEIIHLPAKRVFIVTIKPLLPKLKGLIEKLESDNIKVSSDTSVIQEPSFSDFNNLLQKVILFGPDVIVGIGGGSVLDVAKLAAALPDSGQTLEEMVGSGLLKGRKKKLICVPATSGTGSEVSPNAILVDLSDNQKKGIISPFLVPDIVYVDPLLTMSVPASVTAATGLDALTHNLEAYTNRFAQPFIDMYALKGMSLIAANLVQAVKNGEDEEARTQVAMGSLLGGFCLGPVNTAGVHALSYPLGSTYHLPHGLSNALLLPYVMEFNIPAVPHRYADVAVALGCTRGINDKETAEKGVEKIRSFISECGIPARLRDVGIPENDLPEMAEAAMKIQRLLKNNPRHIDKQDVLAIYAAAY
jgi:alcohol dehydrogenase class IV